MIMFWLYLDALDPVAAGSAFGVMFVLDFIWARYTRFIVEQRPWASALAASAIMVCNGIVTLLYVGDPLMLGFAAMGAFAGTAAAVKWHHAR